MSEEVSEFGLLVSFPDQSASFVHGFEAGGIWQRLEQNTVAQFDLTTHFDNREVIQRMAGTLGWTATVEDSNVEGWDNTSFSKVRMERERANPHGLRLV